MLALSHALSLALAVVRQSRLQPVRALHGAPQGPPRPALLHPAPQLRVAAVECDSRQHSGGHPAQSSLLGLYRWACSRPQWAHANTLSALRTYVQAIKQLQLCLALCYAYVPLLEAMHIPKKSWRNPLFLQRFFIHRCSRQSA